MITRELQRVRGAGLTGGESDQQRARAALAMGRAALRLFASVVPAVTFIVLLGACSEAPRKTVNTELTSSLAKHPDAIPARVASIGCSAIPPRHQFSYGHFPPRYDCTVSVDGSEILLTDLLGFDRDPVRKQALDAGFSFVVREHRNGVPLLVYASIEQPSELHVDAAATVMLYLIEKAGRFALTAADQAATSAANRSSWQSAPEGAPR